MIADTDLSEAFVHRNYRARGLQVPAPNERVISDSELHSWHMVKTLLNAGLPEERMLELSRLGGRGAAEMAEAVVDTFIRTFLQAVTPSAISGYVLPGWQRTSLRRSDVDGDPRVAAYPGACPS